MSALPTQGILSVQAARTILVKFFWIEEICDGLLAKVMEKQGPLFRLDNTQHGDLNIYLCQGWLI